MRRLWLPVIAICCLAGIASIAAAEGPKFIVRGVVYEGDPTGSIKRGTMRIVAKPQATIGEGEPLEFIIADDGVPGVGLFDVVGSTTRFAVRSAPGNKASIKWEIVETRRDPVNAKQLNEIHQGSGVNVVGPDNSFMIPLAEATTGRRWMIVSASTKVGD